VVRTVRRRAEQRGAGGDQPHQQPDRDDQDAQGEPQLPAAAGARTVTAVASAEGDLLDPVAVAGHGPSLASGSGGAPTIETASLGESESMSPRGRIRVMKHTVAAELVANVAQVPVAVGDAVGPTDIVVLLDSMKMEIPVLAEVSGTVAEVAVGPGDVVTEGDVLAVIETA
jgi:acetyl-CoA carboxylase biotin carboxyl carrier protein